MDKTYVLASFEMTQNLAYVAMTRHREAVHVYGSSLDFWRPEKLPQVLAKSGEKLSAADYLDAESLAKLMKTEDHLITKIFQRLSDELEAMGAVSKKAFWQVADYFLGRTRKKEIRVNPESLREEARAEELLKKGVSELQEKPAFEEKRDVFKELTKHCERYLYDYLEKENRPLTPELTERIPLQAERAANLIFHAHTLKGTSPTEEQTKLFLLRAKYELDRLSEIQKEVIKDWQREDTFNDKTDCLLAHMLAERQASIEGRLYVEAKQKGEDSSSYIADLAESELKEHRAQTLNLAEKISQKYGLSERAATHCVKDILRYKETHGEKPTSGQIESMAHISRELEKKYDTSSSKERSSHTLEYLRRKEGDLMFRHLCSQDKAFHSLEDHSIQTQAKKSLETFTLQIAKDLEKIHQREMSL